MTSVRGCHHHHSKMFSTGNIRLTSSASEQNVFFTYVCLVDEIRPTGTMAQECDRFDKSLNLLTKQSDEINQQEEPAIQVERTKALYELVESSNRATQSKKSIHEPESSTAYLTTTSGEENDSDKEKDKFLSCDNPNVLKLTKMKWLTEDPDESGADSSSPSLSSITSNTSTCSKNSECDNNSGLNDKYLSTILRLDKEHNMFGLSSIAIIGPRKSKQKRAKDDERAVFHQTAIIQVCCDKRCCRHASNTDLPASLKCGTCKSCCFIVSPKCANPCFYKSSGQCSGTCSPSCSSCCYEPYSICNNACSKTSCVSSCKKYCPPALCKTECNECFGLKIKVNRKPVFEPPIVELTPRNSSILKKPFIARTCHHTPQCIPPSDCFPYLLPCFWPASSGSPCSDPANCFHNPPCPPPRSRPKVPVPSQYKCPTDHKCIDLEKKNTCPNEVCPGNIATMREAIESRYGTKEKTRGTAAPTPTHAKGSSRK